MTKELPPPELLRKLMRYDPDTGKLFWRERPLDMFEKHSIGLSWNARWAGREAMTADSGYGYMHGTVFSKKHKAHRICWALYYGVWPSFFIDHINGNKSDNRIKNLRDVPREINARNSKKYSNNTSGYNGVYWCKLRQRWASYITVDGARKTLGRFDSFDDAVLARREAERGHGFTHRHGREMEL